MNTARSRTRNLTLAAVLAGAAGVLTLAYVAHGNGSNAHAAAGKTTAVLVATRDLDVGVSATKALASGAIAIRQLPAAAVAPGALTNAHPLRGEVVVQPIYAGDQISGRRFGPSGTAGVGSLFHGDERILQVPGDANQLLAGTVQDGDHVDVVASVHRGQSQTPVAAIVLRDLLVLHAPSSASTAPNQSLAATVEVTDAQAQTLFYVLKNGDWSFVLRPAAGASASQVAPSTAASVLAGS